VQPLVSIVTPVYQGADTLRECIDSILAQTYQNWEYTIVDNCSTDGSAEIARRYAATDSRIRVLQNERFLRVIANHNHALRQIFPASKYCKVVFADDWIVPTCVERMVRLAEDHPSVGLVGAYWREGDRVNGTGLPRSCPVVSGREICRRHFLDRLYVFGSPNAVLYRADFVRRHDRFYNEANLHADTEVCFELLKTCDFGFVHDVLTVTRVRPGSLSSNAADLNTEFVGLLHILFAHGRDYLTEEEFQFRLERHLSDYYRLLSKNLFVRRDKKFWNYHRTQIDARLRFSRLRLAQAMLAHFGRAALNPRDAIEKLVALGNRWRNLERRPVAAEAPAGQFDADGRIAMRPAPDRRGGL
jgi:glycosyltransferase involved in cell wall biosynthesis